MHKSLLLTLPLLFPAAALATTKTAEIAPGKIAEECFELAAGDKVGFGFTAAQELEFNVHYHEGKDVKFPVPVTPKKSWDKGEFDAPVAQTYCLMWKNAGKDKVSVAYWFELPAKTK